jgi:hypothetical protein
MLFIMNGTDLSSHVQESGIVRGTVYRNTKSRVTIEGKKYQGQIKKLTLTVPFDPMSEDNLQTVLSVVDQDYVDVQYRDPVLGIVIKTFIPSVGEISLTLEDRNGVAYWSGLSVKLEEQ